jgi:hypothetical protein
LASIQVEMDHHPFVVICQDRNRSVWNILLRRRYGILVCCILSIFWKKQQRHSWDAVSLNDAGRQWWLRAPKQQETTHGSVLDYPRPWHCSSSCLFIVCDNQRRCSILNSITKCSISVLSLFSEGI